MERALRSKLQKTQQSPLSLPILCEEIIFEILSWLPVKSLLQLRTVCKSWKSLISDPCFVKLHLQRSSRNVNIILQSELDLNRKYIFAPPCSVRSLFDNPFSTVISSHPSFRINLSKYDFLDSCNGLLCLYGADYTLAKLNQFWVRFWNPATKLRSPKSPCLLIPTTTEFVFGFGYDISTNTYKVVMALCDIDANSTQVKVYCMGANCWRNIPSLPLVPILYRNYRGVYLNGTLNWLAFSNSNPVQELVIVSLHLGKETSTLLVLPHATTPLEQEFLIRKAVLAVLRERLSISYDYNYTHFIVWQMMEFGVPGSWVQSLKVSYYHDLGIECRLLLSLMLPFHMYENGDILMTMRYGSKMEAIMYKGKGNRVERPPISDAIEWLHDVDHVESLVSPLF